MGGRGGYRSTSLQLGDVGLVQDKYFTNRSNQVNFARQTFIKKRFEDLRESLATMNKESIKQSFLKIFTEEEDRVDESISQMANKEAKEMIEFLFS